MIFEPKTCLYVSSITKPYEKKVYDFSKRRIFSNSILFCGKTAFLQISADFATRLETFFFHLIALVCSSSGSGDMRKKHKFQKQLDLFFCYSVY